MENVKSQILMDHLIHDFLIKFNSELERTENVYEYYGLISAVSVFKELVMTTFKFQLELDPTETEESVDDICEAIDNHAIFLAKNIDYNVMLKTAN